VAHRLYAVPDKTFEVEPDSMEDTSTQCCVNSFTVKDVDGKVSRATYDDLGIDAWEN